MARVGINELKPEQEQVICSFLECHDIFAIMPTGYGNSYCFTMLPHICDYLQKKKNPTSIVIIVSSLQPLSQIKREYLGCLLPHLAGMNRECNLAQNEL